MFLWQLLTATSVRCTAGELGNLGRVHHNQGHLKKASDYYNRARAIFFWKSFDLTMFMWQLLTAVWVRYTGIIVHSSFYIKRSSDLGMLTLQIFIITWNDFFIMGLSSYLIPRHHLPKSRQNRSIERQWKLTNFKLISEKFQSIYLVEVIQYIHVHKHTKVLEKLKKHEDFHR